MHVMRFLTVTLIAVMAVVLMSCGGGGGNDEVTITSINLNPGTVSAGSIVALSASITAPGQSVAALVKNWTVSAGTLTTDQPDFSLLLRQTAHGASAASVSTTASTIYWVAPTDTTTATISLGVDTATKTQNVSIGTSPVTMSVTNGQGGTRICTVSTNGINDLYQVAFRINFTSAWQPTDITPGDFLGTYEGSDPDVLWIGMTDQTGFVPVAITRKADADGVSGSGELATVTFGRTTSSVSSRELSDTPFDLGMIILRDSNDQLIRID